MHLGRSDTMIKVRGFRVEPTEVEAALTEIDVVCEAAVLPYLDGPEQVELAAVVTVADTALGPAEIRRRARDLLPPGMVPTRILIRDGLPRTANGKLDRRGLAALVAAVPAAPSPGASASGDASGPDNTYGRLLAIWRAVLRTDEIAAQDDFFALGGTSISALTVISRVRKEFGVPVRLAVLFETPTLAALADAVDHFAGTS